MWLVTLRDLQWRRRRFLVAVLAAALVFAMTLLLSGVNHVLRVEPGRIVDRLGANAFVVPADSTGPFTATSVMTLEAGERLQSQRGVDAVEPFVYFHATVDDRDFNVLAIEPGGMAAPAVVDGDALAGRGQMVSDRRGDLETGETYRILGQDVEVVGESSGTTFNFGTPTLFLALQDAQAVAFDGQPLAMAILTKGVPGTGAPNLEVLSNQQARADLERPLVRGAQSIDFISALLWLVAAGIIGSIVYLSALERLREFAVLKATGASNRSLLVVLALQAVILSATAAVLAAGIARLLAPMFPFAVEVPPLAFPRLLVVAMLVGLAASAAGLRRAVSVQPALAFGGP